MSAADGRIRIATRKSPLAMWQAEAVQARLLAAYPGLHVELVPLSTRGDRILDRALQSVGGKALFIKELEQAILDDEADIAVHSMKDVTAEIPDGFAIPCLLERGEARDAWVSETCAHPDELGDGARVGTSSLRRQAQLAHRRPDLDIRPLRGNVGTRLSKLDAGEFDGIVLAGAGLQRLGLDERIRQLLEPEVCLPAVGQGVVGIECRADDEDLVAMLAALEHHPTRVRVTAERAVNARLSGSCHVPIAAYAELDGDRLSLRARVGEPDGSVLLHEAVEGPAAEAEALGIAAARALLERGADRILAGIEG